MLGRVVEDVHLPEAEEDFSCEQLRVKSGHGALTPRSIVTVTVNECQPKIQKRLAAQSPPAGRRIMWHRIVPTSAANAVILVRLTVGAVFLSEGIQKFLFPDQLGTGRFLKIGLPMPELLG